MPAAAMTWTALIVAAGAMVSAVAIYVMLRWRRSPAALKAMGVVSAVCFVAGVMTGVWVVHLMALTSAPVASPSSKLAPSGAASYGLSHSTGMFDFGPPGQFRIHYDLARALLPDPNLTPGAIFPDATADDVCTPGWASEHRHVTEGDRARVYAEYPDSQRTCGMGGCEVDHLIPLELGGSNDIKNLWPEPSNDPRPGSLEKDQLENDLHHRVCKKEMSLQEAQKCIASDWVNCWQKYVLPGYGAPAGTVPSAPALK